MVREMKVHIVLAVCLLAVLGKVQGKAAGAPGNADDEDVYGRLGTDEEQEKDVQNDDNNYDYGGDAEDEETAEKVEVAETEVQPTIETAPQEFIVNVSDTVKLPCKVSNGNSYVVMWKRQVEGATSPSLLFQSDTPLTKQKNIKLLDDDTLELYVESDADLGLYICQVAYNPPLEVTHKVFKAIPPQIVHLDASSKKLKPGDRLRLECNATGHPEPTISWIKDTLRLTTEGPVLELPEVTFKDAGAYRCFADNKHGKPAHSYVEVFVIQKPTVSVEKFLVSSDKEHDAELHCTVHAYPVPVVFWQKNGQNIGEQPPRITLARRKNTVENILTIRNLEEGDFGVYTCSAKNAEGMDQRNVTLVRTPAIGDFEKPEKGGRDVVLTWKVESKSPIVGHELQYRKKGETKWTSIMPEVRNGTDGVYKIQYTLKALEPGTYETRARSQNSHGWSDFSEVMPFEGVLAKHGDHHKHKNRKHKHTENTETRNAPAQQQQPETSPKETAVGASHTGGCAIAISSISLLSISLLVTSLMRQ